MELYDTYANYSCSEVPPENLKMLLTDFLYIAAQDMGQTFDKSLMVDRIYYIINTHYNHLPLSLVASAFKRGALGQYGPGRLVPRTVYGWLAEMNQYHMNLHDKKQEDDSRHHKFDGLQKYPLGKAICKKIDWLSSGAITLDEWDKIPLKELAGLIGSGKYPTPGDFNL